MPNVSGDIPNLVNGISQQAPALRLPSQMDQSENFHASLLDGAVPRANTEFLAKLLPDLPDNAFTHILLRDANEKYIVVITTDTFKVYDFDGVEKSVTDNSGTYLDGLTNPKVQLRALTVADYTFIVNKSKVVALGNSTEPTRPHEALIYVMAGNYGKVYSIDVNGVRACEHMTQDGGAASHSNYIDTKFIADMLFQWTPGSNGYASFQTVPLDVASSPSGTQGLIGAGLNTSPWAVGRYGNVIYLRNNTNDFTIAVSDGYSNRAMKALKKRVQSFSDLPNRAPSGVVMEVLGDESTGFDNYWVKYESSSDLETGTWKECPAPGVVLGLNAATMPHQLVRQNDGTFVFGPVTWDQRKCGDDEKAPHPSFVGQTIEDVFFHRNRIGFLTKENIVMSEAGKFFNFYRTTLTALLDSDPIDVAASHVKVSFLHHAVPYQDVLLLFSDNTQFKLSGNELLTPKTVNARPVSEIPSLSNIRPETSATSMFFMTERNQWASLFEYYLDKQLESADYDDVSAHAPAYIPAGVHKLAVSADLNVVMCITDGDPDAIYVYKYFYNGQEKIQSAWYRWTFPYVDRVVNFAWDNGYLIVLLERDGDLYLERMDVERRPFEDDGGYTIRLDMTAQLSGGSYNAGTGRTTFTVPYPVPEDLVAVTLSGTPYPKGLQLEIVSSTSTTIVVDGNLSSQTIVVGLPYVCRIRMSPFYYRGPDGKKAVVDGRLQIRHLTLVYSKSAYFRVEVTPIGRSLRTVPFNGRILADPNNMTGEIVLADGKMSIPVLSRNDRVTIEIVNDTWLPCAFTSANWHGVWTKASREL